MSSTLTSSLIPDRLSVSSSSVSFDYYTPLFSAPSSLNNLDSPPESPNTPWRPGSTAYPANATSNVASPVQVQLQLQMLYESVAEGSYDLSLRDLVQPPFSIDTAPSSVPAPAVSSETVVSKTDLETPENLLSKKKSKSKHSRPQQGRIQKSEKRSPSSSKRSSSISSSSSSSSSSLSSSSSSASFKYRFVLSFNFSRSRPSFTRALRYRTTPSLLRDDSSPSPRKSSAASSSVQSSSKQQFKHSSRSERSRPTIDCSSRVHPSNQCSSCSSYTVFFKSRCMECGKLYCSNCAKDAMDNMMDGRRCKGTCGTRLVGGRLSKAMKNKCWPLCGTIDVRKNNIKTS